MMWPVKLCGTMTWSATTGSSRATPAVSTASLSASKYRRLEGHVGDPTV